MTDRPDSLDSLMTAMEALLDLSIEEAWRPRVLEFLTMAANNAALYADLPFDDAKDEAAPVFRPGNAQ